jgi:AbrB family looped-hinge helix DNA binding protein
LLIPPFREETVVEKAQGKKCCATPSASKCSYQVEAIITVDERGQMVLPKETRARAGIRAGDKLALVGWRKGDQVCCLSLIKVEEMAETVGELMNSLMGASAESRK